MSLIYNSRVRLVRHLGLSLWLTASAALLHPALAAAQKAPDSSAARILLLPRRAAVGERATLAVLDVNGRLTPAVTVAFSNGTRVTTDATGRAAFLAPSIPGVAFASLPGRPGRVPMVVAPFADVASATIAVRSVPQFAPLADRFELSGSAFCGDADANRVTVGGRSALVVAASSRSLVVIPPEGLDAGPAQVTLACGSRTAAAFSITFLSLDLVASSAPLAPGERRELVVRVRGTASRVLLEARNHAPEIAELVGGDSVRLSSSGGAANSARFELLGRSRGSFLISIRLVPSYIHPPHP